MDLPPELPPLPVAPEPPPRELPTVSYFLILAGLYTLLGSVAQACFLPIGIWWSQLALFIVPTVLLLRALGFRARRFLRFDRLPAKAQLLPTLAICVAVFFCASALMAACEEIAPAGWADRFDISKILDSIHGPWQVVLFASVVVGAPLAEETVFRGYLLPALRQRLGLQPAILVQALLFSLIHLDPIGFMPRLILGLVFGYLVTVTGSIWSSVFAHALNNGVSTVLFFVYGPGPSGEAAPDDPRQALLLSLGAGVAVMGLAKWLQAVTPVEPVPPTEDPEGRGVPPALAQSLRSAFVWSVGVAVSLGAFGLAAWLLPKT